MLNELIAWVLGLFTSLTGFSLQLPTSPLIPAQLTAEQVVDLEVEAEGQFLESGGQY